MQNPQRIVDHLFPHESERWPLSSSNRLVCKNLETGEGTLRFHWGPAWSYKGLPDNFNGLSWQKILIIWREKPSVVYAHAIYLPVDYPFKSAEEVRMKTASCGWCRLLSHPSIPADSNCPFALKPFVSGLWLPKLLPSKHLDIHKWFTGQKKNKKT